MSKTYVNVALRQEVIARAKQLCEYCLLHEDDTYYGCQVDYIISEKHGGTTTSDNLALACSSCNRNKGSDIGSIVWQSGEFVRFFNPRVDYWNEHFKLKVVEIVPLTEIGEVTVRILDFNHAERIIERQELQARGRFPSPEARILLTSR